MISKSGVGPACMPAGMYATTAGVNSGYLCMDRPHARYVNRSMPLLIHALPRSVGHIDHAMMHACIMAF